MMVLYIAVGRRALMPADNIADEYFIIIFVCSWVQFSFSCFVSLCR